MAIKFASGDQTGPAKGGQAVWYLDVSSSDIGNNTSGFVNLPGDVGNHNAVITPSSNTSKILVMANCQAGHETTWRSVGFIVERKIGTGSWAVLDGSGKSTASNNGYHNTGNSMCSVYFDNPQTTSQCVYRIRQRGHNSGGTYHHNQMKFTNTTNNDRNHSGAVLFLMEIFA